VIADGKGVYRSKSVLGGGLSCSCQLSSSADCPFLECQLPKLDVAGSIPVSRSIFSTTYSVSLDLNTV
jgi:hypothetical protein